VKTAGTTTSVFFFVGACDLIRGPMERFISFFFFDAGVAFVAAIADVIAGLPILLLMGRDCQETLRGEVEIARPIVLPGRRGVARPIVLRC
jgi:hypothetical protein